MPETTTLSTPDADLITAFLADPASIRPEYPYDELTRWEELPGIMNAADVDSVRTCSPTARWGQPQRGEILIGTTAEVYGESYDDGRLIVRRVVQISAKRAARAVAAAQGIDPRRAVIQTWHWGGPRTAPEEGAELVATFRVRRGDPENGVWLLPEAAN